MLQANGTAGAGNLARPLGQNFASHRREPHPLGEALAIHLPPQHSQLDQPHPLGFDSIGSERAPAEAPAVVPAAELIAAEGLLRHRSVKRQAKGQAAQGLAGALLGASVVEKGVEEHAVDCGGGPVLHGRILPDPMLLLASASPARRRLLEQAGIPHRVQVSGVDEAAIQHGDPRQLVQELARAKAEAVASTVAEGVRVLGCDSLLVFEGEVFGKPADAAQAQARWQRMAGRWGELITGHCLLPSGLLSSGLLPSGPSGGVGLPPTNLQLAAVVTRVQFASLSPAEIEAYVATGEPLQCAGGFALEGRGGLVVERIEGCFSNVIGLSLPLLRRWLAC